MFGGEVLLVLVSLFFFCKTKSYTQPHLKKILTSCHESKIKGVILCENLQDPIPAWLLFSL